MKKKQIKDKEVFIEVKVEFEFEFECDSEDSSNNIGFLSSTSTSLTNTSQEIKGYCNWTTGLRITYINDTLVLQGRHDTQHKGLISYIEHNDTQHNETLPLC